MRHRAIMIICLLGLVAGLFVGSATPAVANHKPSSNNVWVGPGCPGSGWHCYANDAAAPDQVGTKNRYVCTNTTCGPHTQTATGPSGSNEATCLQFKGAVQSCNITQVGKNNRILITQTIFQKSNAPAGPEQAAHQDATTNQDATATGGSNYLVNFQFIKQFAEATSADAIDQQQDAEHEIRSDQSTNGSGKNWVFSSQFQGQTAIGHSPAGNITQGQNDEASGINAAMTCADGEAFSGNPHTYACFDQNHPNGTGNNIAGTEEHPYVIQALNQCALADGGGGDHDDDDGNGCRASHDDDDDDDDDDGDGHGDDDGNGEDTRQPTSGQVTQSQGIEDGGFHGIIDPQNGGIYHSSQFEQQKAMAFTSGLLPAVQSQAGSGGIKCCIINVGGSPNKGVIDQFVRQLADSQIAQQEANFEGNCNSHNNMGECSVNQTYENQDFSETNNDCQNEPSCREEFVCYGGGGESFCFDPNEGGEGLL